MLSFRNRWVLFLPLLLVLLPLLIWPVLSGLFLSFTNYAPGQAEIHWVGWANYAAVLGDASYRTAWVNVLLLTILSVPAELLIGLGLAFLLRDPFRGRGFIRAALLIPWLVSPIGNGVMWYFLFNLQFGMLSYARAWLGMASMPSPLAEVGLALPVSAATLVWRNAPLAGFLLLPGLLAIPRDSWEEADLEGASFLNRVRWVAWPWIRPLFLAVALILTGDALGTFDTLLILTGGGPGSATLTPGLYSYQQAFQVYEWPLGTTSAWLIVLSVVIVGIAYLGLLRLEKA